MTTKIKLDAKVCRDCSVLALANRDRCINCGSENWGPIPRQLAWMVHPRTIEQAPKPLKLRGYRGLDWPIETPLEGPDELPAIPRRDPEFAAMLASLAGIVGIWGIGHIYVGKALTGVLLMLAGSTIWSLFVGLIFMGKGVLFAIFGIVAWAALIFWAYPEKKDDPFHGRWFLLPTAAITLTVYVLWSHVEITYIFMALGITMWMFLTTRAYNLAVEFNESMDRTGTTPW